MICPHCRKPIPRKPIDAKIRADVLKLSKQGYSARDIEKVLGISFSSAAKIVRDGK